MDSLQKSRTQNKLLTTVNATNEDIVLTKKPSAADILFLHEGTIS